MRNRSELDHYCLAKPGAELDQPFGPDTIVFKVLGKMFALYGLESDPLRVNLKCDPDWALALRDMYGTVLPGYHMNKRHWNTVILDGSLPDAEVRAMIDHSYELVKGTLTRAQRAELQRATGSTAM